MRLRKMNNNPPQIQTIYKLQPRLVSLVCSKTEITAFLEDGRKLVIPTT